MLIEPLLDRYLGTIINFVVIDNRKPCDREVNKRKTLIGKLSPNSLRSDYT